MPAARYGLSVDQAALNAEPGGEGRWRGGKGIDVHYRVRADADFLSVRYTRSRIPPWGGGLDGSTNHVWNSAARTARGSASPSPPASS